MGLQRTEIAGKSRNPELILKSLYFMFIGAHFHVKWALRLLNFGSFINHFSHYFKKKLQEYF